MLFVAQLVAIAHTKSYTILGDSEETGAIAIVT